MKPDDDDDDDDDEEEEKANLKKDDDGEEEEDTVQANFHESEQFKLPAAAERAKEGESNFIMSSNYRLFDLEVCFNSPSHMCVGLLLMDLQTIHQRIKDNVDVLSHFSEKREEGKERSEYLSLLRSDLCTYYSYNEFLIGRLMDLFPLSEVCAYMCSCFLVCGDEKLGMIAFNTS